MSHSMVKEKIEVWIRKAEKFKYALLILMLGICLMINPKKHEQTSVQPGIAAPNLELEQQLEQTLSLIDGAGDVCVMLSIKEGETNIYQTNTQSMQDDLQREQSTETVLITGSDGTEQPIIVSISYPVYKGAVVLCQGADNPSVRLSIVNAVSDLTGLGADKISVIKMKVN